ncbi:MAG TPA: S41 family peptidase [Mycobacteriales bacterium]|nr:S41 family peptidase [Mycobacteriales bacterium]
MVEKFPDSGSPDLRSLYLPPEASGVRWLLDPDSTQVRALAAEAESRSGGDSCDWRALAADLPDLDILLQERHFALATGLVNPDGTEALLREWRQYLENERPGTWGTALAAWVHKLRWAVGDNHLRVPGEDPAQYAAADPRAGEPVADRDAGPIITEQVLDGVLCLRIRQFGGRSKEAGELASAWERDHARHFEYDRIIVDLRGNSGGSETYLSGWISDHVRFAVQRPPWTEWYIGDQSLSTWNTAVLFESVHGRGTMSAIYDRTNYTIGPRSELRVDVEENAVVPPGADTWNGKMLVVTDRLSASAAEGAAWTLRTAFGARIIGRPSAGMVAYGNITQYLLPRSGLSVNLATASAGWSELEMTGVSVDRPCDPRMALGDIAARFDSFYGE